MGHIHKYSMHCLQKKTKNKKNKNKAQFHLLLLLLSSNCQVCCWTIVVHRQYTGIKDRFFKNVCVAGMAVRLNMSPASLCSHVHKKHLQ